MNINSIKQRIFYFYLKKRETIKRAIKYVLGIDVDVVFWFMFSFIVLPHITLTTRIIGIFGWTYIYRVLVKDIHTYAQLRRNNK